MTTTLPSSRARLALVHAPTPLVHPPRLAAKLGVDLWVKRDDATGGAEAGNKLRKLEYLLAEARAQGATVILTCGGEQSNHARATALAAASQGMRAVLFLRRERTEPGDPPALAGNVLLDRLAGAEIRVITRADYARRNDVMAEAAAELDARGEKPYVIPEGGSNGLGALGYVEAMRELRAQVDAGLIGRLPGGALPFDEIVLACGSGGTAAGVALGAALHRTTSRVRAVAVCDDAAYFEAAIARVVAEARALDVRLLPPASVLVDDGSRGPAYGVPTAEQSALLGEVARLSGLVLDPVYSGKAFHALVRAARDGAIRPGARVLFLHTGGLPGLLARPDLAGIDARRV